MAIYDAIRGYRTSMEHCGIPHRDVSIGNILIAERQPRERVARKGILHDDDYSSMTKIPPLADGSSTATATVPGQIPAPHPYERKGENEPQNVAELKERTGTYYLISVKLSGSYRGNRDCVLHDTRHDLEWFIWVLVWIVLRHVRHGHKRGREAWSLVFKYGDDDAAASAKYFWLLNCVKTPLSIRGDPPLTDLLNEPHELCVLAVFKTAIERENWATDDRSLVFEPPKNESFDARSENFDNDRPTVILGTFFETTTGNSLDSDHLDSDQLDPDQLHIDYLDVPEPTHRKKRPRERFADEEKSEGPSIFTESATGSRKRQRNNQGVAARSPAPLEGLAARPEALPEA
ncbi:hypothetical protein BC628DRAFT_1422029 [Trametes gibbosa]|nr:hypothetical protein BC628DRAFT_1422029 [Trametes gibbosa]